MMVELPAASSKTVPKPVRPTITSRAEEDALTIAHRACKRIAPIDAVKQGQANEVIVARSTGRGPARPSAMTGMRLKDAIRITRMRVPSEVEYTNVGVSEAGLAPV